MNIARTHTCPPSAVHQSKTPGCGPIPFHAFSPGSRQVVLSVAMILLTGSSAFGQRTIFVDAAADGADNGTSWADAYNDLQGALIEATHPAACSADNACQIWVVAGVYKPARGTGDRNASFRVLSHVAVYGGFAGGETSLDQRDWVANETTLSGDLNGDDGPDFENNGENSLHVVTAIVTDRTAILDGFTITAGNADTGTPACGGGMFSSFGDTTVANCAFTRNWGWDGAGMCNFDDSHPALTACAFTRNSAGDDGGAMYNVESAPILTGCAFTRNSAGDNGGAMHNVESAPALTDCTFAWNQAGGDGGAMYNYDGSLTLTNCAFMRNSASNGSGGAMYSNSTSATLVNCTLNNNSASWDGGAMKQRYCDFTLIGCTFTENSAHGNGGAMYSEECSLVLAQCAFNRNWLDADDSPYGDNGGGGMCNEDDTTATLTDCTFVGNWTLGFGGGGILNHYYSAVTLANCIFSGNSAYGEGGAIRNHYNSTLTAANCAFSGNSAGVFGGAIGNHGPYDVVLGNCTFRGNSAYEGRAIAFDTGGYPSTADLANCILWDGGDEISQGHAPTITVSYSNVQGGWPGEGNIDLPPVFTAPDGPDGVPGTQDDDLRLAPVSPGIDAGDNRAVPADALDLDDDGNTTEPIPFDLDGLSRFVDHPCSEDTGHEDPDFPAAGIVDMGAYEYPELDTDDTDSDGVDNCLDNCPVHPNPDQEDCDDDHMGDVCALALGRSQDCNGNEHPDGCDIANGESIDGDGNGVPDECQRVLYVDADAPLGGNGLTWDTAYDDLQDALNAAADHDMPWVAGGVMLWVADGVYIPSARIDPGDLRTATFQLLSGVGVYGGFTGSETSFTQRDPVVNVTILSGDVSGDDVGDWDDPSRDENCYSVVTGSDTDATAILDGFTITGGNGNGDGAYYRGGGMFMEYGGPTVVNCVFTGNWAGLGGGLYNRDFSSPSLINCVFAGNRAELGAGLHNTASFATVTNCRFFANQAQGYGGGVRNFDAVSVFVNCWFRGNRAFDAGGMRNEALDDFPPGGPKVINCTFSSNSAGYDGAGGIDNYSGTETVRNCILWGNWNGLGMGEQAQINHWDASSISYNCIQGWTGAMGGVGNIGDYPMFVEADGADNTPGTADDNVHLLPGSPCADAADNGAVPADTFDLDRDGDVEEPTPFDLDGEPRFVDDPDAPDDGPGTPPIVDMGAYEGPAQGLLFSTDALTIPEGGVAVFTIALALDPGKSVQVTVARHSGDPDITVQFGETLLFDSSNYAEPQPVTLAAAEDADYFHGAALFRVSASGFSNAGVDATEQDNDTPAIIYVDTDAPGTADGTSWENAFTDLQQALGVAVVVPEVEALHVAQGIYKPAGPSGDRAATFQCMTGLSIVGGYAGYGTPNPDRRDIVAYETILSGDLNGDDVGGNYDPSRIDNTFHVVTIRETDSTAVLDGLTVTAGSTYEGGGVYNGGGIYNVYGSPTLIDCTITGNATRPGAGYGGGMRSGGGSPLLVRCLFIDNSAVVGGGMSTSDDATLIGCRFIGNSAGAMGGGLSSGFGGNPTLIDCTFSANSALDHGGGMSSWESSLTLTGCILSGNFTAGYGGGIAVHNEGDVTLTNCVLSGNSAGDYGGGLGTGGYTSDRFVTLLNCVFSANTASRGAGLGLDSQMHDQTSTVEVINSILWDGGDEVWNNDESIITIAHSDVQGGWSGEGNISDDPLFVDPDGPDGTPGTEDDNLRLSPGSPAINTGDPFFIPQPNETDLDSHARVLCDRVDMGPYEFGIGDYDCDQVVDLTDFAHWIDCITGPHSGPYAADCPPFDFDADDDVDLTDLAGFQTAFTGP